MAADWIPAPTHRELTVERDHGCMVLGGVNRKVVVAALVGETSIRSRPAVVPELPKHSLPTLTGTSLSRKNRTGRAAQDAAAYCRAASTSAAVSDGYSLMIASVSYPASR